MSEREDRIRTKAQQLWVAEGRPEGRADIHWTMALEMVTVEDGQGATIDRINPTGTATEHPQTTPSDGTAAKAKTKSPGRREVIPKKTVSS